MTQPWLFPSFFHQESCKEYISLLHLMKSTILFLLLANRNLKDHIVVPFSAHLNRTTWWSQAWASLSQTSSFLESFWQNIDCSTLLDTRESNQGFKLRRWYFQGYPSPKVKERLLQKVRPHFQPKCAIEDVLLVIFDVCTKVSSDSDTIPATCIRCKHHPPQIYEIKLSWKFKLILRAWLSNHKQYLLRFQPS